MLSPNHGLADKRNGPWAVPKSSESSHAETFSLQKSKKARYMLPLFWNLHCKFY